jgi:hypothetical protein
VADWSNSERREEETSYIHPAEEENEMMRISSTGAHRVSQTLEQISIEIEYDRQGGGWVASLRYGSS